MSKVVNEVVAANQTYAQAFGAKGELPLPPARQFAILTCMDARLDPAKYAGLAEGDAHVIRNAGGRWLGLGSIIYIMRIGSWGARLSSALAGSSTPRLRSIANSRASVAGFGAGASRARRRRL